MDDLLPDWNAGSQFRRYVVLPAPLPPELFARITDALLDLRCGPYVAVRHSPDGYQPGVTFVPRRADLDRFEWHPDRKIMAARTARDPDTDAALVSVMRVINAQLRRWEYERGLTPYSMGRLLCDDCGAHEKHRSRRMIRNHWPVADGSPCGPWKGAQYNQVYGLEPLEHTC